MYHIPKQHVINNSHLYTDSWPYTAYGLVGVLYEVQLASYVYVDSDCWVEV